MLVTALAPTIGYDKAAAIAKTAHKRGPHPARGGDRQRAVSGEDYDRVVRP